MNQIKAAYATQSVPRYTSYPTAPHFGDDVDDAVYAAWLVSLPADQTISLYLHVPYCQSICHYCGCHTKAALRDGPIKAYAARLRGEIDLVLRHLGGARRLVHLHWGGGTPSILAEDDFRAITARIQDGFVCDEGMEHAIELDPRTVTPRLAALLRHIGITRVNLGVQDFNPEVQLAIGRYQPYEQIADAVATLRYVGLSNIGFDLMYGLPQQGVREVALNAERAAELRPDRIAVFGYAHVPWMKKHQRRIDSSALPDPRERLEQEETIRQVLQSSGYVAVGLDHFALPEDELAVAASQGRLRRNFQGYTTDTADVLIGAGASAIGSLPQGYVQNITDIGNWQRAIDDERLPAARGRRLSAEDRLRRAIIQQIMCFQEVDLDAFSCEGRSVRDPVPGWRTALEPLVRDGLVQVAGSRITVVPKHRALVRIVAAAFDAYLPQATARHSSAV